MIRSSLVMLCALAFAISGCSTGTKSPNDPDASSTQETVQETSPAEVQGPPEPFGPTPAPTFGPDPVKTRPIVLVLSPGMARGYAHAGVIRALVEKSIPIGAIYAAEMGSLVATLYAIDPNLNRLEWSMMRFDKEVFAKKGLIAAVFPTAATRLDSELKRVFGEKEISEAGIPVTVALRVKGTTAPTTVSQGSVTAALRAALAFDGILEPARWADGLAVSANRNWELLVREARARAMGPVVAVNVTGEALPQDAQPDLLLSPSMDGLQEGDFNKRTEFAFRGSRAVLDVLPKLRELTGTESADRAGH